MIDYIAVSDDVVLPGIQVLDNLDNFNSSKISCSTQIPENSLYYKKSFKVWLEHEYEIGDHFLVTCQLKVSYCTLEPVEQKNANIGQKLDILKWKRNDHGNPDFWIKMKSQLEHYLSEWDFQLLTQPFISVDSMTKDFNYFINLALSNSLKFNQKQQNNQQSLCWNPELFRLSCDEKKAFLDFKHAPASEKPTLEIMWRSCKKKLKKSAYNVERVRLQTRVREIETLKSKDPKEYWNRLYDLDDTYVKEHSTVPLQVKNSLNQIVSGDEACKVWITVSRNWV
jgi:hypothetical protein